MFVQMGREPGDSQVGQYKGRSPAIGAHSHEDFASCFICLHLWILPESCTSQVRLRTPKHIFTSKNSLSNSSMLFAPPFSRGGGPSWQVRWMISRVSGTIYPRWVSHLLVMSFGADQQRGQLGMPLKLNSCIDTICSKFGNTTPQ